MSFRLVYPEPADVPARHSGRDSRTPDGYLRRCSHAAGLSDYTSSRKILGAFHVQLHLLSFFVFL